ncbi:MAG TPA: hypothetical protein PK997_03855 [Candidatus Omnitrophota bacterium]|nr:hypothetical protein [Candidatus Omnitrophota bacterium]
MENPWRSHPAEGAWRKTQESVEGFSGVGEKRAEDQDFRNRIPPKTLPVIGGKGIEDSGVIGITRVKENASGFDPDAIFTETDELLFPDHGKILLSASRHVKFRKKKPALRDPSKRGLS